MYLRKKILLGFIVSSIIITILIIYGFFNFLGIKNEIRYLELADTLRSKSLELRRHEKNFFLYGNIKETKDVHIYLKDLEAVLNQVRTSYNTKKILDFENKIDEYKHRFTRIELIAGDFLKDFNRLKPSLSQYTAFLPLIETTFLESPSVNAGILEKVFMLDAANPSIKNLHALNAEVSALRVNGEELLIFSQDIDTSARNKVDRHVTLLQTSALYLFPLFFFIGLGTLIITSNSIIKRLKILTKAMEKTGKGDFTPLSIPLKNDEVDVMIKTFNKMESDLISREEKLKEINEQLLQNRKLVSIGTLASGVAHELNNPLNNIYTTAQRLLKKAGDDHTPVLKKGLDDIFGQSMRVKRIVGNLLEFAKGRALQYRELELNGLVSDVYRKVSNSVNTDNINFKLNPHPSRLNIEADAEQIEQVFINLFTNAVEAMSGAGDLTVETGAQNDHVSIKVADSGHGIPANVIERLFEPFFTTKDRGTGLGLSIVFNIIQKHNGRISVESKENSGTIFTIILPGRKW